MKLREILAAPAGGETARAFILFSVLVLGLTAAAGVLSFRDLSRMVVARRVELGREEGMRIADAVGALGRDREGINYHRVRSRATVLAALVRERLVEQPFIRRIDVVDRFGARVVSVEREPDELPGSPAGGSDSDGVPTPDRLLVVRLKRGAVPEGEIRLVVSQETSTGELADLRRSLRFKVAAASAFGIGILLLAFAYVLHLIRKNRVLEQSRLAAERRSYVGLLASGLAHEIRNPLNAMSMNLQMLEEELQGVPEVEELGHHELLESTKSEIKRLERLVNNFLAYARPAEPRFESRDLNGLLQDVARFLLADFRQSGVDLQLDLEPLLPAVELDPTQFKQALMNLLVNARQVLRTGGNVALRSRTGGSGEVVVEVEDDGPGIPPQARDRIFEVFYSNRGGGTGLGLPIAKQIIERHGGTIEVSSAEGQGTTFRIRLPRHHAGPAAPSGSP